MLEQFDDETINRLLKDKPSTRAWKDIPQEEQAAIRAAKKARELEAERKVVRERIEKLGDGLCLNVIKTSASKTCNPPTCVSHAAREAEGDL